MNNSGFVAGARGGQSAMKGLTATVVAGSRAIMGALAPIAGVFAGIFAARSAITGAREAIAGERKLAAVLNASGHAAGMSSQAIADYAEERMGLTNFDDDSTIGAASILASFGNISGTVFTDTLSAAQDLSTVLGTDLSSASMMLGKALNDPAAGLTRLTRLGITFTEQQKEQIRVMTEVGDVAAAQSLILDELQRKFGGAAEAVRDPWLQLKNILGEVAENMGHVLLPTINSVSESLMQQTGVVAGNAMAFKITGEFIASVFEHIGVASELAWTLVKLGVVRAGNGIVDAFNAASATVEWFVENAGTMFTNWGSLVLNVFRNMSHNIQSIFEEVWEFIESGGTNAINTNLRSLTEGFQAQALTKLEIPAPVISDLEQQLAATAGALTAELAVGIGTDITEPIRDAMMEGSRFAQDMMANMEDDEAAPSTGSQGRPESSAGALDARTREAVSAVARATNDARGPQRIMERQLTALQSIDSGISELVDRPDMQLLPMPG